MLPERLLRCEVRGDRLVARYLGTDDEPWLERLLEIIRANALLPRRDLDARLSAGLRADPPARASRDAVKLAMHVALGLCADASRSSNSASSSTSPREVRWRAFRERGRSMGAREDVLATVARELGIAPSEVERSLLADIPAERVVGRLPDELSPRDLALTVNLQLAQGCVARASRLSIDLEGHARRVVQHATWQGLLCTAIGDDPSRCRLDVSGPLAVLHPTRLYSRALASLVPVLPWCRRFRLAAACEIGGRELVFELDDGDPIARGIEPTRHDSLIEEAFEADVRRLAPDWDVLREPRALPVMDTLVFPDFAIGPSSHPESRVLVEIVGWWTRDYLESKLGRLREAGCDRLILCLEERARASDEAVTGLDVLTFRRRVDVSRVLERARAMLSR